LKEKHAGDNKGGVSEADKAYGSAFKTILDAMQEKIKNSGATVDFNDIMREGESIMSKLSTKLDKDVYAKVKAAV
jgi:hypothetical protein